jgi:hypothetical protein
LFEYFISPAESKLHTSEHGVKKGKVQEASWKWVTRTEYSGLLLTSKQQTELCMWEDIMWYLQGYFEEGAGYWWANWKIMKFWQTNKNLPQVLNTR